MRRFGFLLAAAFFLSSGLSAVYGYEKDLRTNTTSQEVKKEVIEVAQAKDTSLKQESQRYQKKIQKELNDYKKKMKQFETKAKNLKDQAKAKAKEEMGELQKKMKEAERKLKSMKSASGEAWDKLKAEVDSAMGSVKEGYEKIAAQFQ